MNDETLADLIRGFHVLIILFVLLAPFSNSLYLLIAHFFLCISLFVHWYTNQDMCSLSIIESRLRGLPYTESTTHKFISPIYKISNTDWNRTLWVITTVLFCITIYNLITSRKWKLLRDCLRQLPETQPQHLTEQTIKCMKHFFI